jgi:hypothetical protein
LKKAAFNGSERKRLYKEAKTFLKVRAMRNKLVKNKANSAGNGTPHTESAPKAWETTA